MNTFLSKTTSHNTVTENGALAHSSTGSILADQFSKASSHRGRSIQEVFAEQSALHVEFGIWALRFVFYNRLITRKVKFATGDTTETVQKGQGNRDESFKRFLWYAVNQPNIFYHNLWLLPVVGSHRDLIDIYVLAKENNIELDVKRLIETAVLIGYDAQDALFFKYLPTVKSGSKLKTVRGLLRNEFAKLVAKHLGFTYKELRQLKSGNGSAFEWQQKISNKLYNEINFSRISGKALTQLVNGKFIDNHGLTKKYEEWIESQPVAKFTGYPFELMKKVTYNMKNYQVQTVNKQFDGLIKLAKEDKGGIKGNVWCALDTSGSMGTSVGNGATTAYDVCISLGIYFSTLNEGAFHKNVIMFDSQSEVKQLSGTFTDMVGQLKSGKTAWGSTNFQSVIDEIVRIRTKFPKTKLEDFPQTLLVVSDMQFDAGGSNHSNHEVAMHKLKKVFPAEWVANFKVIWWDCVGRVTSNQPSRIEDGGTFVFSGFDGAVITTLLGGEQDEKPKSMEQSIEDVLSQEVLQLLEISND